MRGITNYEIILIENGSTDASFRLCEYLAKKYSVIVVRKLVVKSYGSAVKKGLELAKGKIIVLFNVDYFDVDFLKKSLYCIQF